MQAGLYGCGLGLRGLEMQGFCRVVPTQEEFFRGGCILRDFTVFRLLFVIEGRACFPRGDVNFD